MMEQAQQNGVPIFWEDLEIGPPNSAGGKKISWNWHNVSGKTIKYASFSFKYFNAVGDLAFCEYGAGSSVRQTGPIEPGSRESRRFSDLCYETDATCGELQSATIEFMDGSSISLSKNELLKMDAIDTSDKCDSKY